MFHFKVYAPKESPLHETQKVLKQKIIAVMEHQMQVAENRAKENVTGGGNSKSRLNVRSGRLRSSIFHKVEDRGTKVRGIIGTNVIYARIHEKGGTIYPKKQFLTIPINYGQDRRGNSIAFSGYTKAGVGRWSAKDIGFGIGTFIGKSKSGKLYIFATLGNGQLIPIFRLVRSVTIPKRPYLRPALESVKGNFKKALDHALRKTVKTVKGKG